MTINSFVEISSLKKKIYDNITFNFEWKSAKKIFKREKMENLEKKFQKKMHNCFKRCLEECSSKAISEIVVNFVLYPKFSVKLLLLFLNQIIESFIKYIPFIYLKNNFKVLFKLIDGRFNNQIILPKIYSFLDIFYNSKGRLFTSSKKENYKKSKIFNNIDSYEKFQICIENLRNKLDNNKFITSGIIINKFLLEIPKHLSFSKGRVCLYEQIVRIIKLGHNFKTILTVYFARFIENSRNQKETNKYLHEFYIMIFYLVILDKSQKNITFYYRLVYSLINKYNFFKQDRLDELLNFSSNWYNFKHSINPNIKYLSMFSKESSQNVFKYFKANYIKQNILQISKSNTSLFLTQYAIILEIDNRDLEHWIHELINTNKIKAKIDRASGIIYFNLF